MTISILSLHTYPVKSCGSITHTQIGVSATGLAHDREWVVVDHNGHFLTQRTHPRMALVQPALDASALFLNAPEMPTLRISLRPTEPRKAAVPLHIWNSPTLGQDEGDLAGRWFSDYLGLPCRLYRTHPEARRLADPNRISQWRERNPGQTTFPEEHLVGFADGFPFLIANQASLEDLNTRLLARGQESVSMTRFRPNIVVQGLEAYEEDYVSSLQIGPLTLALVKRCPRCTVPNVDPLTAETSEEPMHTLQSYRSFESGVLFGVNAVIAGTQADSVLSVGDQLVPELDI
ncbi:MAG TPA: MOSC N-terminal beta barrel domain-containing protein [Burkholderiaceae bacterium]|nr:MOSC N-terminal beta barrel domain-containing protein [Burkholderiaceae bacterium]